MLPLKNRLKKKKDFRVVFEKGKKAKGDFILAKAACNGLNMSRFGVITSRKIAKKAVVRNKLKRWARAVIKEEIPEIRMNVDCVILFISLPESFDSLKKDAKKIFKKLGLSE